MHVDIIMPSASERIEERPFGDVKEGDLVFLRHSTHPEWEFSTREVVAAIANGSVCLRGAWYRAEEGWVINVIEQPAYADVEEPREGGNKSWTDALEGRYGSTRVARRSLEELSQLMPLADVKRQITDEAYQALVGMEKHVSWDTVSKMYRKLGAERASACIESLHYSVKELYERYRDLDFGADGGLELAYTDISSCPQAKAIIPDGTDAELFTLQCMTEYFGYSAKDIHEVVGILGYDQLYMLIEDQRMDMESVLGIARRSKTYDIDVNLMVDLINP
jgi:hypothetical protein